MLSVVDERRDVLVHGGDRGDVELLLKDFQNVGCEESGQRGASVDIAYTEREKGQEYDDGLLFVPGDVVDDRQVVDAFDIQRVFQREGYADEGNGHRIRP